MRLRDISNAYTMAAMSPIERAIRCFGSQTAMAAALGVKQPTISEWLRGERPVPAERCPQIERETRERGDAVLCEDLRPDVAWGVVRSNGIAEPATEPKAA